MSIFRGGGSIKVDTSINRAEEEEALEDQRRRNEEVNMRGLSEQDTLNPCYYYSSETNYKTLSTIYWTMRIAR